MTMRWSKELSRTDAQEETLGYKVPYIRLTRSGSHHDTQTWFRDVFFDIANWQQGFFGEHPVEEAHVDFQVTILGQNRGVRQLLVTHDGTRQNNNNTPNSWVHYDDVLRAGFDAQNLAGAYIVIERHNNNTYHLTIQAAAPNPRHLP